MAPAHQVGASSPKSTAPTWSLITPFSYLAHTSLRRAGAQGGARRGGRSGAASGYYPLCAATHIALHPYNARPATHARWREPESLDPAGILEGCTHLFLTPVEALPPPPHTKIRSPSGHATP